MELVERARSALAADPRVVSAWLTGSLGRGDADDWSDVDLWVVVEGDRAAMEPAAREHIRQLGTPLHAMEIAHNAPPSGLYIMAWYHGAGWPQHVDWTWQPVSLATTPPDAHVLFDRVGLPPPPPHDARRSAEMAAQRAAWFWMMCPVAAKYIARRQSWEALAMLDMLRRVPPEIIELLAMDQARVGRNSSDEANPPARPVQQLELLTALATEVEVLMGHVASRGVAMPDHLAPLAAQSFAVVGAVLDASATHDSS